LRRKKNATVPPAEEIFRSEVKKLVGELQPGDLETLFSWLEERLAVDLPLEKRKKRSS